MRRAYAACAARSPAAPLRPQRRAARPRRRPAPPRHHPFGLHRAVERRRVELQHGIRRSLRPAAGPGNRLTVDATGIVPGDQMERVVDLTNGGTLDLSGVTLSTTASLSSALDTDTVHGLQVSIDRCSGPWTEGGTAPGYVYACSGTTSSVLSAQPVIMSGAALAGLSATTAGNTDHLRVVLTFPPAAGDSMQGLSSHLAFTFTGSGS